MRAIIFTPSPTVPRTETCAAPAARSTVIEFSYFFEASASRTLNATPRPSRSAMTVLKSEERLMSSQIALSNESESHLAYGSSMP